MKRSSILAAAIFAALSIPLQTLAETLNFNVYGKLDVSYNLVNTGTATNGTKGTTIGRVSSNTSRLGLKGDVNIADGVTGIWQVESQLYVGDSTAATFGTRNTFAGVKSDDFGTLLAGRHDTPYRLSTRRLDVFPDGVADNRSIFGGVSGKSAVTAFDGRQNQILLYISPKVAGFTGAIGYVNLNPSLTVGTVGADANTSKQNALSLAGWYDNNGWYGSLAYEIHKLAVTAATAGTAAATSATAEKISEKAARVGFGYTQALFSVNAAYEKTRDDYGVAHADKYGHNTWYLSGKFNISDKNSIKAAITRQGNISSAANTHAKQYSLGFDHTLTPRATVYALYSKIKNGSAASYGLSSNGTAGASSIVGTGASPSVIAAGVTYTF